MEKYLQRLRNNPKYQYGTVVSYKKAIAELIELYGTEPSIEDLNKFITDKCNKRQPYVKYAIREYFEMMGRMDEYYMLVQAKIREPIRTKKFLTMEQLNMICSEIRKPLHKAIATIQIATAARVAEVITIQRKYIKKENNCIRIKLMAKGDKPLDVFLRTELWDVIEPYYKEDKEYLFFDKETDKCTKNQMFKKTYTLYKRYLESLKEAAKKHNIDIATHDLRRSVANLIKDPRTAQKVLGHSSLEVTERYLQDDSKIVSTALLEHQKSFLPD